MDSNNSSDTDAINILLKIQSDIKSEWEGDEPGINFFLLLAALLIFVIWVVFICFFFSRLLGIFVAHWFRRFLKWSGMTNIVELSIGSFSVSVLSGKIMFREVLIVTDDYTLRINDGWLVFSYWKYVPKDAITVQDCMNVSRVHILLNGLKIHVFNRFAAYQQIAKQTGFAQFLNNVGGGSPRDTVKAKTNSEKLEMQLDSWWNNIWRLFGAIRFDIGSGRLIAGNHTLPTSCAIIFENFQSRIFLTNASNREEDRYMFRVKATMENVCVSLVKSPHFVSPSAGVKQEDPPRTMGDGFAILQTAMIQFYYHQDLLGLVKDDEQSPNLKVPVWETIWRLGKNTVFSYGPWADKQRALIYSYFFPSDYGCMPVTEMPKKGERRILINHDVRISLLHDASIDFWFMRSDELNAIHSRVKQGSSFEFYIPFVITEKGFISDVRGSLLCLEATSSLPFREFISCETLRFKVTSNFARAYNHQQVWDIFLEMHQFSTYLAWDHKRFIMDIINEWTSDNTTDLCTFVPCTWNFNISVVDRFEFILLLNDKNWVDTNSALATENIQLAVVGSRLYMNFSLVFIEFEPDTIPFELKLKAENDMAVRVFIPPTSTVSPLFEALLKSAKCRANTKPSNVHVNLSNGENWTEIWRTETILLKCEYEYYSMPSKYSFDLLPKFTERWIPKPEQDPWQLQPDNLYFEVEVSASEILLTGLLIKLVLSFKDNYFSDYDKLCDVADKPKSPENVFLFSRRQDVECFRPMNVFFRLQIEHISAHCLTHQPLVQQSSRLQDLCPLINLEQLVVELKKDHEECLIQVACSPVSVTFSTASSADNSATPTDMVTLSGLQFRGNSLYSDYGVPWSVEILEYAWLVEVIVGDIGGKVRLDNLCKAIQFLDSLLILMIGPDEEMVLPESINLCHHFENIRHCSRSEADRNHGHCHTTEAMKYRLIRASVDSINLFIEENNNMMLLNVAVDATRFSFCNAHTGTFNDNLTAQLFGITCDQFVRLDKAGRNWMRCGSFNLNKINFDLHLPRKHLEEYLSQERRLFLLKHDKASKCRMYFLWRNNDLQLQQSCACFGDCHFFASNDLSGKNFFNNGCKKLSVKRIQTEAGAQPYFLQSILDVQSFAINLHRKDSTVSSGASLLTQIDGGETRKSSSSSSNETFHFASSSSKFFRDSLAVEDLSLKEYVNFLDLYCVNNTGGGLTSFSLQKVSSGIYGLKLLRKPDGKRSFSKRGTASEITVRPNTANDTSSLFSAATSEMLSLNIKCCEEINLILTPLSVEFLENYAVSVLEFFQWSHPAYSIQALYRKCSLAHHDQPLTASSIERKNNNIFQYSNVQMAISLPTANLCFLQCKKSMSNAQKDLNSVGICQIQSSILTVNSKCSGGRDSKNERLLLNWELPNTFLQLLQIVEQPNYDNVFDKVPVPTTPNWSEIFNQLDNTDIELKLKTILDVHLPQVAINGFVKDTLSVNKPSEVTRSNGEISVDVDAINVIAVLGKSIEDPPSKANSSVNQISELTFYETLSPILNAWIKVGLKCKMNIEKAVATMRELSDMVFMRLLAEALDWHDDRTIIVSERACRMQEVKMYHRNFCSCPSCKLTLNVLQYISLNEKKIQKEYASVHDGCETFRHREGRATAIIALLSHWQTLICNEVQLADNSLAQRYKYNAAMTKTFLKKPNNVSTSSEHPIDKSTNGPNIVGKSKKPKNLKPPDKNSPSTATTISKKSNAASSEKSSRDYVETKSPNLRGDINVESGTAVESQAALSSITEETSAQLSHFRPTHRRGASTTTQLTVAGNESEQQDLYHWILKAHKEYKERRSQHQIGEKFADISETEVNSMELLLPVFFWTIYENLELERSSFDFMQCLKVDFGMNVETIKLSIVEKKFLLSQQNEVLVALSSHHLVTISHVELGGILSVDIKLDEFQLKPACVNFSFDYSSKVQDIRLLFSLASVFFISDLSLVVRYVMNMVNYFNDERERRSTCGSDRGGMSSSLNMTNVPDHWTLGVLDKLHDYERSCAYKRHNFVHSAITGNWSIKSAVFESLITDLIISMTFSKINFNQKHCRLGLSCTRSADPKTAGDSFRKRSRVNIFMEHESPDLLDIITKSQNVAVIDRKRSSSESSSALLDEVTNQGQPSPQRNDVENDEKRQITFVLDHLNLSLKRANLVVAAHVGGSSGGQHTKGGISDPHQILNCSLRESIVDYRRLIDDFRPTLPLRSNLDEQEILNRLKAELGQLECDLPIHAESIHEMVLRHGPQLNEQIHRIIGQPQLVTFDTADVSHEFLKKERPLLPGVVGPAEVSLEKQAAAEEGCYQLRLDPELNTNSLADLTEKSACVRDEMVDSFTAATDAKPLEIEYEIQLLGIELNAQLLSSLKGKYRLQRANCTGKSGNHSQFSAEIADHQLYFLVTSQEDTTIPADTFTLQLPRICANGSYQQSGGASPSNELSVNQNKGESSSSELIYRDDGFFHITILMGSMIHTFSTDLLNQILFAEQSFRSELLFLLDRLSSERPKMASGTSFFNVNPVLFDLEIKGEGVPWLQITATTPTSVAVRFTIDNPCATFTNRLVRNPVHNQRDDDSAQFAPDHRLFGRGKVQLNVKLGQLYKSALYEETQEELEEFANFMTQISVQNDDSVAKDSFHSFLILLNRPFLLIKSNAIDKAILLWLNYRNTYNYWRKERQKLLSMSNRNYDGKRVDQHQLKQHQSHQSFRGRLDSKSHLSGRSSTVGGTTSNNFASDMNINLSLSIQNGLYVCMPLYSPEPSDNLAALMLSLQKSDVTVCIRKELACNADFSAFKVTFVDNFDEQSLSEPWLYETVSDSVMHSNFFFFPHGSYQFCTSAVSSNAQSKNAKWILSVKAHMEGMLIDFDYKIGKLTSLLIHTLSSSLTFYDEFNEDYAPSDSSFAFAIGGGYSNSGSTMELNEQRRVLPTHNVVAASMDKLLSDVDFAEAELNNVVGHENRVRWIERKMHEQSVLVTDLMNLGASEFAIEKERRKLRILELTRFKQFRRTMWDKLRQKVDRKFSESPATSPTHLAASSAASRRAPLHRRQSSRVMLPPVESNTNSFDTQSSQDAPAASTSGIGSAVIGQANQPVTESVDMNIDVQINIECGQCILRANQPPSSASYTQKLLTKKPSARDLKGKANSMNSSQAITKLSIPSLSTNMFYTSNDPIGSPPECISRMFAAEKRQRAACADAKNKCFYMTLELASMPLETLITPCLADFLEQVVEPLPESLFEPSSKVVSDEHSNANSVPIVAIDTSSLPLDVLFHMSVQSSTIRFEGQQQRSSAADCLLTLPGLILMASTRKYNEEQEHSPAGIYLSATLSSFSLSIYSPHQQSSAHDAFSLTLDRFSITASRSKSTSGTSNEDDRNRVELVILSNVGSANFNYDMRRLSELLTFPRPWYRKQLIRRLFFGEHSVAPGGAAAAASGSNLPPRCDTPYSGASSSIAHQHQVTAPKLNLMHSVAGSGVHSPIKSGASSTAPLTPREWAACVMFSMQWKELNVNAQMSNTMGSTVWLARNGVFRGHLQLDSQRRRDVAASFKLHSSELTAQGGAISGEVSISKLLISARHTKGGTEKAPENMASLEFEKIESRVEWMSRPIFIGRFVFPNILITDDWSFKRDKNGEVVEAVCMVNMSGSWNNLQMIITKNTVADTIKIGNKLISFFKDQLKNSKIVWDHDFYSGGGVADAKVGTDSSTSSEDGDFRGAATSQKSAGHSNHNLGSDSSSVDSSSTDSSAGSSSSPSSNGNGRRDEEFADDWLNDHWKRVLDALSDVQLRQHFLPLPTADNGVTLVGGNIGLSAKQISVACMNGEMNASSWALFHMSEVGVLFNGRANYAFVDTAKSRVGVEVRHKFSFVLGEKTRERLELPHHHRAATSTTASASSAAAAGSSKSDRECNAVVCRVQHSRGMLMRHNASIDLLLDAMIGDVLKQLMITSGEELATNPSAKTPPRFTHNVLRLFIFPALEAILQTTQHNEIIDAATAARRRHRRRKRNEEEAAAAKDAGESTRQHGRRKHSNSNQLLDGVVESTFVCDFQDAVCVQTDFNAQVGFLPELLKSYMMTSQPDVVNNETAAQRKPFHPSHARSASALSGMSTASVSGSPSASNQPDNYLSPSLAIMETMKAQQGSGGAVVAGAWNESDAGKDPRQYVCLKWVVDPKIMFIDRFKWNPPVIDDILKKLQIFDHRQTIPKVMQRGVLDRCDLLLASIVEQLLLSQIKRGR